MIIRLSYTVCFVDYKDSFTMFLLQISELVILAVRNNGLKCKDIVGKYE